MRGIEGKNACAFMESKEEKKNLGTRRAFHLWKRKKFVIARILVKLLASCVIYLYQMLFVGFPYREISSFSVLSLPVALIRFPRRGTRPALQWECFLRENAPRDAEAFQKKKRCKLYVRLSLGNCSPTTAEIRIARNGKQNEPLRNSIIPLYTVLPEYKIPNIIKSMYWILRGENFDDLSAG